MHLDNWISPWPFFVFNKYMDWLQQIPVFIIMAQQPPENPSSIGPKIYLEVDPEDGDENLEIDVFLALGHA